MELAVGQVVEGKVKNIANYGAFVDIGGGKTGMVHISELSVNYVKEVKDVLKEGDEVKAIIIDVDEKGRVKLSIKKLQQKEGQGRTNGGKAGGDKGRRDFKKNDDKGFKKSSKGAKASEDTTREAPLVWEPQKSGSDSFEEMMEKFKKTSDEKFSDLKRKNFEVKRPRRGGNGS